MSPSSIPVCWKTADCAMGSAYGPVKKKKKKRWLSHVLSMLNAQLARIDKNKKSVTVASHIQQGPINFYKGECLPVLMQYFLDTSDVRN